MSQNLGRSSSFGPDMGRKIIRQVRQIRSISFRRSGESNSVQQNSPPAMRDLQEFLAEAELGEYYSPLCGRLKVSNIEHLKYVREEDLEDIGMSRPEMRRLKKFYRKEFPQGTFNKLKKALRGGDGGAASSRTLSPSPTEHRSSKSGSPSISAPSTPGRHHPPSRQLIPSDALEMHQTLGEGEFGVVVQATWTVPETGDKLPVAVKKLLRDKVSNGTQTFLKEAAMTQDMEHDSIVRLYGVVLDQDQDIALVTELAPMRSLLECLHDESLRSDLSLPRLCDFGQQVCEGMVYLEAKRMVHRDLAARNVLVFNKNQVKVSDLGLSRALGVGQDYYQSSACTGLKLPVAWCAPECINFLKFTSASDVWSFGVLLWECFTYGQQPWEGMSTQQILQTIDAPHSKRLPQPELCTPEFYQTMQICWSHAPEGRPPFAALLVQLPQLRPTQVRAIKDYPKPTVDKGYICYKNNDVIVVVDKTPSTNAPAGLVWKGVLSSGAMGLFDPTHVVPFIEPKISPLAVQKTSLARKESGRKSGRKILRADMISRPQNDLRHTGHIGYDGAVFGDVSFIGNNYDKLPLKVEGGAGEQMRNSQESLDQSGQNGMQQSWLSRDSLSSQMTMETEGRQSPNYLDVEDDSLFSDFKMPDLGSSLDFGGSFMDEVLKALDAKEKEVTSSNDVTPSDENSFSDAARFEEAPKPVPRGSIKSSAPPLPSQPPRNDPPPTKEKKQAKVKPMSTSDERIMEAALANARELTALRSPGECHSPTVNEKSHFFNDDSPGFVSKLRNSLRRSTSPKTERKRTFSDELESKGDIADELTPEAQQAYNSLVVKGEGSSSSSSSNSRHHHHNNDQMFHHDSAADQNNSRQHFPTMTSTKDQEDSVFQPPEPTHRRANGTPPRALPHTSTSNGSSSIMQQHTSNNSHPTQPPPQPPSRPLISAPVPQSKPVPPSKPVAITHPTTNAPNSNNASSPVPAPRPPKPEPQKSDIPVPKPRPEIQRVEPTIRHTVPDSPPEIEHKPHIPMSRKDSSSTSKEREREDLKKTIEIVRVDDSASIRERDELLEKNSLTFDRSSARSSQRSSLDRSDATSENAESERAEWEHSEYSSDSSRPDPRANSSFGSGSTNERQDSFSNKNKQLQSSSLFEEDLSEPSPQEIMSRLREKRLNRHLDHQRGLTSDGDGSSTSTTTNTTVAPRPRPNAREPQGIPGRTPSVDLDDGGGGEGSDEVDTNPLRMLRGGAIPIRTGRGSAGNHRNQGTRGAPRALRVPALNFSSPLSRIESSPMSSSTLSSSSSSSSSDRIIYATIQPHATANTAAMHANGYEDISNWENNDYNNAQIIPSTCMSSSTPSAFLDTTTTTTTSTTTNTATTTTTSDAAAELMLELDKLTSTLMEGDLTAVASAVAGRRTSEDEVRKFTQKGHRIDLAKGIPPPATAASEDKNDSDKNDSNNNNNDNEKNDKIISYSEIAPTYYAQSHASAPLSSSPIVTPHTSTNLSTTKTDGFETTPSTDSQSPPAIPQRPNLLATKMKLNMVDASSVPPRLPPRRTQSLTENPDKSQSSANSSNPSSFHQQQRQRSRELRRSNSLEEPDLNTSQTPPLLPPRVPQQPSTNPRPIHRKFPLTRQVPSPVSPTSSFPSSKSNPISLPERQPINSSRSTLASSPSSSFSSTHPHRNAFQHSRSVDSHSHHLLQRNHLTTHNNHHHQTRSFNPSTRPIQSSRSFDLPPTSDISHFISDTDSEPTHMLLESPPSQCHVPSLVVNLPSTSEFRDEPTHIPLSWSSSFPSQPHTHHHHHNQHHNQQQQHQSQTRSNTANNTHKFSHNRNTNNNNNHHQPQFLSRYPSVTDHQSPPADLPPAPPTPSYREKLGLPCSSSQKSSMLTRSVSHDITTTKLSSLPGQPPPLSPRNQQNTNSLFYSMRRRSSSMTSPQNHNHHLHHNHHHNLPPSSPCHHHSHHHPHPLVSPLRNTTGHNQMNSPAVFRYPDIDNLEMGDDDAFFSEAPSVPHPYSQSPFHPIVTTASSSVSNNDKPPPSSPTATNSHSLSSTTTNTKNSHHLLLHPQSSTSLSSSSSLIKNTTVSSSSSQPAPDPPPPPISPRTTSRGIVVVQPPSPLTNNNSHSDTKSQNPCQLTTNPNSANPALPPRSPIPARSPLPIRSPRPTPTPSPIVFPESSSSSNSNDPSYLRLSSASSSPTHAPLPSPNNFHDPNPNLSTSSDDDESENANNNTSGSRRRRSPSRSPPPPPRFKFTSSSSGITSSQNKNESESASSISGNQSSQPTSHLHHHNQNQNQNQHRAVSSPPPPSAPTRSSLATLSAASATTSSSSKQQQYQQSSSSSSLSSLLAGSEYGEADLSPAMLARYKNSSTVSYEDLMEFALDSQKNCEEIETLLNIFRNEVSVEDCMVALENTRWDVTKATKYIQLKKLLCVGIADIHRCKESLVACGWDVERAAEALLESAAAAAAATSSSSSLLPPPSSSTSTSAITAAANAADSAVSAGIRNDDAANQHHRPSSSLSLSSSTHSSNSLASSSSLSLSSTASSSSSSSRVSPARSLGDGGGGGSYSSSTTTTTASTTRHDGNGNAGGRGGIGGGGEFLSSIESSSSSSSSSASFGPASRSSSSNNTNRAPTPETVDV